jgi:hypothetical protein
VVRGNPATHDGRADLGGFGIGVVLGVGFLVRFAARPDAHAFDVNAASTGRHLLSGR